VQWLRVFGSVLSDRFDPERSDIDFLVDFLPERGDVFDDYFGLREALAEIVGATSISLLPMLCGTPISRRPPSTVRRTSMRPESAARVRDASEVRVPELGRIVGMRNVIAHEYGEVRVDYEIVWAAVTKRIPGLIAVLGTLLQGAGPAPEVPDS
jgi:hypothetical protein